MFGFSTIVYFLLHPLAMGIVCLLLAEMLKFKADMFDHQPFLNVASIVLLFFYVAGWISSGNILQVVLSGLPLIFNIVDLIHLPKEKPAFRKINWCEFILLILLTAGSIYMLVIS
jgi:hypothetical protein